MHVFRGKTLPGFSSHYTGWDLKIASRWPRLECAGAAVGILCAPSCTQRKPQTCKFPQCDCHCRIEKPLKPTFTHEKKTLRASVFVEISQVKKMRQSLRVEFAPAVKCNQILTQSQSDAVKKESSTTLINYTLENWFISPTREKYSLSPMS